MSNKPRILAVDDNAISLKAIDQALRNEYEVIPVNSGDRAIRYLMSEKPDLVLLDVQMADKDGIETLRELRTMKNGEDLPVIMLTSQNDKDTVLQSSKLGIDDYVLKPFDSNKLLARVDQTLKNAGR